MNEPDEAAQDAAWQEIVAHFGDRVELSEEDLAASEAPAQEASAAPVFDDDVDEPFEPDEAYDEVPESERFVAPRPSLPRPTTDRLFAWIGLLGAPLAAVVLFVLRATLGWYIPGWIVDLLVIGFLAGFAYLVLHMPREPRDPWDDGARL